MVRDGLLRSKLFRGELFSEFRKKLEAAISEIREKDRRWVFLVGIAKHSKVITRYQLAMTIEKIMLPGEARYVKIPRELGGQGLRLARICKGAEAEGEEGEAPKFVAGDMYFVRFGKAKGDPIWAVDIFSCQKSKDCRDLRLPAGRRHRRVPGAVLPALLAEGTRTRRNRRFRPHHPSRRSFRRRSWTRA